MQKSYLIGIFDNEDNLLHAGKKLKQNNLSIYDFYTPFPVHGLDEIQNIERTRLPFVTLAAGITGLTIAILFQVWTSAFDWPINVGGKPMLSIPAFIPVTFELMVLFGALISVLAFFIRSNLYPTKDSIVFNKRQLDDRFIVLVEADDQSKKIIEECGGVVEERAELS